MLIHQIQRYEQILFQNRKSVLFPLKIDTKSQLFFFFANNVKTNKQRYYVHFH
jgi:hypothetical protein